MPIYEYKCEKCGKVASLFVRGFSVSVVPKCPICGSGDLRKLVSRFSVVKSEESRLDDLADPGAFGDVDENDPRSVARWAKRMSREMGEDLGDDFHEMVDRMEAGEMPDEGGFPGSEGPDDSESMID